MAEFAEIIIRFRRGNINAGVKDVGSGSGCKLLKSSTNHKAEDIARWQFRVASGTNINTIVSDIDASLVGQSAVFHS